MVMLDVCVETFLQHDILLTMFLVSLSQLQKRQQRTEPNGHTLSGSVQKRMALFGGGMFRKESPAAASSLYENGYENES